MRFFRRKKQPDEAARNNSKFPDQDTLTATVTELPDSVPARVAARHAVHALAGLLMDRHTNCSGHWWCGPTKGCLIIMIAAYRHSRLDNQASSGYIAAYLNQATIPEDRDREEVNEGSLHFIGETPTAKLVVQPTTLPTAWAVKHGIVIDADPGDHSSGVTDPSRYSSRMCSDAPDWADLDGFRPTYFDDQIIFDEMYEPRFHCVERSDGWNIYLVDVKSSKGNALLREVARFPKVNNPAHLGIFDDEEPIFIVAKEDKEVGNPFRY